ncbi:MAG: YmdB family metallophosphoesterase [Candidatus Abawacabacteria bacterium]|nr:YmdB family metallophosphoesterase [Candidatus Abawacabacteria bacterium]
MTRILCIGDIVGKPGRKVVKHMVPKLRKEEKVDFVIANSDNVTSGTGINQEHAKELIKDGVDILTSGNHMWRHQDIITELEKEDPIILRPENFPRANPGRGWRVMKIPGTEITVAIINLQTRLMMRHNVFCPFLTGDEVLKKPEVQEASIKIIDIHGESSGEKYALFHYFNGRISHMFGTHTHVPTNDAQISNQGTSYISDVGACIAENSIIGFEVEPSIQNHITQMPHRSEVEEKAPYLLRGCIVDIDESTGKALAIQPLSLSYTP